jgi:hypothetical protein
LALRLELRLILARVTGDLVQVHAIKKHEKRENLVSNNQFDFTIKVRHQRKLISRKRTGNTGGQMNQNEHAREIKPQAHPQKENNHEEL